MTEIRVIGRLVTLDDEFQINSVWPRQASRCEVPVANSGQESQSAQTVIAAQFEHEPGRGGFMRLDGSRNGSRRRVLKCIQRRSDERSSLLLEVPQSPAEGDRGKNAVGLRCSGDSRSGRCDRDGFLATMTNLLRHSNFSVWMNRST